MTQNNVLVYGLDKAKKTNVFFSTIPTIVKQDDIPEKLVSLVYIDEVGKLRFAATSEVVKANSYILLYDDNKVEIVPESYIKANVIEHTQCFNLKQYTVNKTGKSIYAMRYDGKHFSESQFPAVIALNAELVPVNFGEVIPGKSGELKTLMAIKKDGLFTIIRANDYVVYNPISKKVKVIAGKEFKNLYTVI